MTHYVCQGTCKGVSDEPKTCGTEECTHHGEPLVECDCTDGQHEMSADEEAEEDGE